MLLAQSFAHMLFAKCSARMLLAKFSTRILAATVVISIAGSQCTAYAAEGIPSNNIISSSSAVVGQSKDSCESCGAPLIGATVGDLALNSKKTKDKSLLTDSLWGNLILELAYERDAELHKLAKKAKLLNAATTAGVLGLAGATLAQGITALYVLNPPSGVPDSYAPLNVGVATSGAMIGLIAARLYCGHKLATHIQQRQVQIRERVQAILAHIEYSQCECLTARTQLTALIGTRACSEWTQLWQSSHQKLAGTGLRISLHTDAQGNALNCCIPNSTLSITATQIAELPAREKH